MKRQGPYAAKPPVDSQGKPIPGLPPRVRVTNPQKGPGKKEVAKNAIKAMKAEMAKKFASA